MNNRIGPYRVLRMINRGGQGSVYLGYDERLHRQVAIKIYRLPQVRAARKALLHEARLVAAIDNPRVVKVHDLISSHRHLAMIMEYVPGCDLETYLALEHPGLAEVLAIAVDLAAAIACARQQRLVHGDIKASNVLIATDGHVKLSDFGIARSEHERAQGEGSPTALAPEQHLGDAVDVRTDLFALGRLLYRLITGVSPFMLGSRLNQEALLHEELTTPTKVRSTGELLPEGLAQLVMELLAKDPQQRPGNTHEVRQRLREVILSLPASVDSQLAKRAAPCFRPETPQERVPDLPPGLHRDGVSALSGGGWNWLALQLGQRRAVLLAVLLGCATVVATTLLWWHWPQNVYVAEPVMRIDTQRTLPANLSRQWLVSEVKTAIAARWSQARLHGPELPEDRIIRFDPSLRPKRHWAQEIGITVACRSDTCLLQLTRTTGDESASGQAVIYTDTALDQWRIAVQQAARTLYP